MDAVEDDDSEALEKLLRKDPALLECTEETVRRKSRRTGRTVCKRQLRRMQLPGRKTDALSAGAPQ